MPDSETVTHLHGTAVAYGTNGVLFVGASGTGKSTLALELLALGASLVADDQVQCRVKEDSLWMSAPTALENRIEARGLGLLTVPTSPAFLRFVVDLNVSETDRLPEQRETVILEERFPLYRRVESPAFASMLWVRLRRGIV